jgi:ABC-type transport system substrate-binding protein
LLDTLEKVGMDAFRMYIVRGSRVLAKTIHRKTALRAHILSTLQFQNNKIKNFPVLTLIANNPEGKNPLIKEICGALKEDLEKVGITLNIDYLEAKDYYPSLRTAKFDLAYRTIKLTGTPSLYRMFYKDESTESQENINYGSYYNEDINEIAIRTKDETDIKKMKNDWKVAHEILHYDPPYLYLWSRRHIIVYNPMIEVITPNPEYTVPYGQTNINGLINVFNEIHLWSIKQSNIKE